MDSMAGIYRASGPLLGWRPVIRRLLLCLAILAIGAYALVHYLQLRWEQPVAVVGEGHYLIVRPGARLKDVARQLYEEGVLADPYLVVAFGRWTGLDEKIKRGEYSIPRGTKPAELLLLLTQGTVIQYQVTLPEGITLAEALEILAKQAQLENVLAGPQDPRIDALIKPHKLAEGLFFPDSYRYEKGTSDWQILQRAHQRMQKVLAFEWQQKAADLPYETPYEALIMASIVERETGVPDERTQIAGVFVRRLQKRMRLQTDPVVIYGLGSQFDGNLRRKHLQDESNLYNTYRHSGLPPGPIALPGQAAINAALQPDDSSALYFVARGDGSHTFSKTFAQHQEAVKKYQLTRRKDYRSSPERN